MKLLSTIILILVIILFPPATLALVSNDAVPGDATYPIKRGLEDVIYSVASLNSTTKAWFAAARSDRRYKELSILILQGKSASTTLNELVAQTDIAAEEIKKIEDPVKKQQLTVQLSESIDKYSQKLNEVSQEVSTPLSEISSKSAPTQAAVATPKILPTPVEPAVTPVASPTSRPTETSRPEAAPTPFSVSTQAPGSTPITGGEIDDAKKKFDDIKKKLGEEKKQTPLTKEENKDNIEKKGNEGVPAPEPDAKSNPAGSVKTKNEKQ